MMRRLSRPLAAAAAVWLLAAVPALAGTPSTDTGTKQRFDSDSALKTSQNAIGRQVGNYVFRDTRGRTVELADLRGKPLVISFIYTSCTTACPVGSVSLANAIEVARDALDADSFNVITVGFDVGHDGPEAMKAFAESQDLPHGPEAHWYFLSGDLPNTLGLVEDTGFVFRPAGEDFDHLSQVSVLDKTGTVYRQVYGANFAPVYLVEPLKEIVFGTKTPYASLDDLVNKVRLFCTIYDPADGDYRFDYGFFIRVGMGMIAISLMARFVIKNWLRIRRREKQAAAAEASHSTGGA